MRVRRDGTVWLAAVRRSPAARDLQTVLRSETFGDRRPAVRERAYLEVRTHPGWAAPTPSGMPARCLGPPPRGCSLSASVHAARDGSPRRAGGNRVAHVSRAVTAAANCICDRRWATRWHVGQVPTWRVWPQCVRSGLAAGSLDVADAALRNLNFIVSPSVRSQVVSAGSCRSVGSLMWLTLGGPELFHASSTPQRGWEVPLLGVIRGPKQELTDG